MQMKSRFLYYYWCPYFFLNNQTNKTKTLGGLSYADEKSVSILSFLAATIVYIWQRTSFEIWCDIMCTRECCHYSQMQFLPFHHKLQQQLRWKGSFRFCKYLQLPANYQQKVIVKPNYVFFIKASEGGGWGWEPLESDPAHLPHIIHHSLFLPRHLRSYNFMHNGGLLTISINWLIVPGWDGVIFSSCSRGPLDQPLKLAYIPDTLTVNGKK